MITNTLFNINMDLQCEILQIMGETVEDEASCLRAAYKVANDPDGPDGIHPHSDLTGNCNIRLNAVYTKLLRSIV